MLAPDYRIFGALGATCGSLMLGWSTALIFAAISRGLARPADPQGAADTGDVPDRG